MDCVKGADRLVNVPRVRTLPVRVAPLDEEGLDSWLESFAYCLDARWDELLAAVGVLNRRGCGASQVLARAVIVPTASQIDVICQATGVAAAGVEAMTLVPWISGHVSRQRSASMRVPGSRFCPLCLNERGGRWRVWWRLRWAIVCLTHHCFLADRCWCCGGLQRLSPRAPGDVPRLGRCASWLWCSSCAGRCSADLAHACSTFASCDDSSIFVQRSILSVLRSGWVTDGIYAAAPVRAEVFVQDLRLLGAWIVRIAGPGELSARISDAVWRCYLGAADPLRFAPSSFGQRVAGSRVSSDALAACVAAPILLASDAAAAAEELRWLASSIHGRGLPLHAAPYRWRAGTSPALDTVRQHLLASPMSSAPRAGKALPAITGK